MPQLRLVLFGLTFRLALTLLMGVVWLDRALRFRMPFPRDPEDLRRRSAWCLQVLRRAQAIPDGAEDPSIEVHEFESAGAFRSRVARVRVAWTRGGEAGSIDLVAKFAPRIESVRDHAVFILQANHLKEVDVYATLSSDPRIATPRAYFAQAHRGTGNLCVLMEWMGGGVEIPESSGCTEALAELAVDAMAAQHAAFWGQRDPAPSLTVVPPVVIDWFATLFEGEHRHLYDRVLRTVWHHDSQAPLTLLHGDARVGNMIFPGAGGRFVLIDWQASRMGKAVFDVAYFLVLSVEPEVRRAATSRLLTRYHAALVAHGVQGYTWDELQEDFRHAVVLVLAFVTLPFMSKEASVTAANTAKLRELEEVWSRRALVAAGEVDLRWLADRTGITDLEALRSAFRGEPTPQP